MSESLRLARAMYDGEVGSSFLQEPLPPCPYEKPEGWTGEWAPQDNRFKLLVDALILDMAQRGQLPANRNDDPATQARAAADEIEAAEPRGASA